MHWAQSSQLLCDMSGDFEKNSALEAGVDDGSTRRCSLFSALCRLPGRLWSFVFFTEVHAVLDRGAAKTLDEGAAAAIHPQDCDSAALLPRFKAIHGSLTVTAVLGRTLDSVRCSYSYQAEGKGTSGSLAVGRALLRQQRKRLVAHGLGMGIETCIR